MKVKIFILGLLFLAGLLFSMPAFAYTYERTPLGYDVFNPIGVYFQGSYAEVKDMTWGYDFSYWRIRIGKRVGMDRTWVYSPYYASTTTGVGINSYLNPDLGIWNTIEIETYTSIYINIAYFEFEKNNSPSGLLNIVEAPPPPPPPSTGGNIITIPADFATSALAYAGNTFSSVAPLILIGIGLMLAFWLISNALRLTNILDKTKSKKTNSWDFFDKEQKEKFRKDDWL